MKKNHISLATSISLAFLTTLIILAVLAFSQSSTFLYRNVTLIGPIQTISFVLAGLSGIGLVIIAGTLAYFSAISTGNWLQKSFSVLPAFALTILAAGIIFTITGIGAGAFTLGWMAAGLLLTTIAAIVLAFRLPFQPKLQRGLLMGVISVNILNAVSWLGILALLVLVLVNQPSFNPRGDFGGATGSFPTPQAGQNFQRPPDNQSRPEGNGGFEGPGRFAGPGGFGGPQLIRPVLIAGAIAAGISLLLLTWAILRTRRSLSSALQDKAASSALTNSASPGTELGRSAISFGVVLLIFFAIIQLVPVSRTNPPVQTTLTFDSPATQELAVKACMDCHSNSTRWPWYATIAPGSWLTALHVNEGRQRLNFSELNNMSASQKSRLANEIADQIQNGNMPLRDYLLIHPDARLTDAEKQQLIDGFRSALSQ